MTTVRKRNYMLLRTRNHSSNSLRMGIPVNPRFKVLYRQGSETTIEEAFRRHRMEGKTIIEINTIEGCKTSNDKLKMKEAFTKEGVSTADWFKVIIIDGNFKKEIFRDSEGDGDFQYEFEDLETNLINKKGNFNTLVAKHRFGSRGRGNTKIESMEEFYEFLNTNRTRLDKFIFEKFHTFQKEYRIHVTKDGYFYTCRKMLREGTPNELKWQRHDDNCVWMLEDNELFMKPQNWDEIVEHCVKALNAVGLDICACDVKTQTTLDEPAKFIILETNSAPAFGDITLEKYKEQLNTIINERINS